MHRPGDLKWLPCPRGHEWAMVLTDKWGLTGHGPEGLMVYPLWPTEWGEYTGVTFEMGERDGRPEVGQVRLGL